LWPAANFKDCDSYAMWALSGEKSAFPADERMRALDGAGLHEVATGMVHRWHPDLRSLVRDAEPAETFLVQLRASVPVEPWPATAVTLLGDAIHAMPPSRGSGANIALKDAGRLCAELTAAAQGERPLLEAVGRYEINMLDYGFAAVNDSLNVARRAGGIRAALATMTTQRPKT
jgi:2-polyprenyl-6-methoxyphenol hydroxylase-like FAD-dependent oxidoreductase